MQPHIIQMNAQLIAAAATGYGKAQEVDKDSTDKKDKARKQTQKNQLEALLERVSKTEGTKKGFLA